MNLKLKRLVRTTNSEQYALFDLDQLDEEDELPLTIGKLDLHYTAEGVYGTMLLWDDASRELSPSRRRAFIQVLLEDIVQPMGVPNEYVIEFFAPTLDLYDVFHNVDVDEDGLDDEDPDEEGIDPEDGEMEARELGQREPGRATGDRTGRASSHYVAPEGTSGGRIAAAHGDAADDDLIDDDLIDEDYDPADYDEDELDDEDARA